MCWSDEIQDVGGGVRERIPARVGARRDSRTSKQRRGSCTSDLMSPSPTLYGALGVIAIPRAETPIADPVAHPRDWLAVGRHRNELVAPTVSGRAFDALNAAIECGVIAASVMRDSDAIGGRK